MNCDRNDRGKRLLRSSTPMRWGPQRAIAALALVSRLKIMMGVEHDQRTSKWPPIRFGARRCFRQRSHSECNVLLKRANPLVGLCLKNPAKENNHEENNVACERCNNWRDASRHTRKCTGCSTVGRDYQSRCTEGGSRLSGVQSRRQQ